MLTAPVLICLITVILINGFIGFSHIKLTPLVLGSELITLGAFMIYKSAWMAKFIYQNLLSYPFLHYLIPKKSGVKESIVKFLGVFLIILGSLLVGVFFSDL